MRKHPLMKPIVDFAFKALFGSEKEESKIILIHLLNAILGLEGKGKINEIIHLNPYNNKEYADDKLSIMDIKVKTEKKEIIDIEMQINNNDSYKKRSLYYWSKLYSETINEAKAYETLKKCVVVNLLNFNLLDETKKYHSKFRIMEIEEKYELLEDLEIHYIELKKFDDMKNIEEMNELEKWLTFIKDAGEKGKEERIETIRRKDEVIDMAGKLLEKLSADEIARQRYLAREKALLDQQSAIKYQEIKLKEAEEKGMEKGIEKGIEKGKKAMVKNLLKLEVDIDMIAKSAEMEKDEILKIKEEIMQEKH